LRDDLAKVFGSEQVFLDKDTLQAGNWRDQIHRALDRCAVVLVIIGSRWLTIADEQNRPRISLPDDTHHQEVALALARPDVTVIPVLVDDAAMPRAEQLPADVRSLCNQQAYKIGDTQARRKADLDVLVKNIEAVGGLKRQADVNSVDEVPANPKPSSWLRPDLPALTAAFVLTIGAATAAYSSSDGFTSDEIFALLLLFYGLVLGSKCLWRMWIHRRGRAA
jgi:hypothetical protein